jgi:hypothetical protein
LAATGLRNAEAALSELEDGSDETTKVTSELIPTIGDPIAAELNRQLMLVENSFDVASNKSS